MVLRRLTRCPVPAMDRRQAHAAQGPARAGRGTRPRVHPAACVSACSRGPGSAGRARPARRRPPTARSRSYLAWGACACNNQPSALAGGHRAGPGPSRGRVRSFGAAAAAQLPGTAVCMCPAGCSAQHSARLAPTSGGAELVVGSHQKGSVGAHLTATAGSGGGTMISWHPGIVAGMVHVLAARSWADRCASCGPTAVISWGRATHGTKGLAPTGVPARPTDKKQRRSYSSTAL